MKLNKFKTNIIILFFILLISFYHYRIQNGLEKIFYETYFDYTGIRRPLSRCDNYSNGKPANCVGIPSGHAETVTIFTTLLYLFKFIPLYVCLTLIFIFSAQRVFSNMHTTFQVLIGVLLGFLYVQIYTYFNLQIYSLFIVIIIGLILAILCVYKLDKEIYNPIPSWVNSEMISSIKKKQDSPLYTKIGSIYINAVIQNRTFISWTQLEKYLNIITNNIQNSGQTYNAVVGIRTGGAIISDYISQKLNLPNYKIKLSRSDYNCNKQPYNAINDIVKKNVLSSYGEFQICEGIDDNLQGKNIILIDELVSSGKTINEAYDYLKNEKQVSNIYPTTISLYKEKYKGNINVNYVIEGTVAIWPWGYDN